MLVLKNMSQNLTGTLLNALSDTLNAKAIEDKTEVIDMSTTTLGGEVTNFRKRLGLNDDIEPRRLFDHLS